MRTAGAELRERLRGLGEGARVALSVEQWRQLGDYVELLFRWNERMNLTALDTGDRGLERLIIEPLLAVRRVPASATWMMDIGSGGGSPAIPMKIGRPEVRLRMVESRARKAAFLRHAVRELDLDAVAVENRRYETLTVRADTREAHDVVTMRGVGFDRWSGERLEELVRPGGVVLIFRSRQQGELGGELAARLCVEEKVRLSETTQSELLVIRKRGKAMM